MDAAPFRIVDPMATEIPVVVEVPHAGIAIPSDFLSVVVAPSRSIGRDADLHVDELYADAPNLGATLICANVSRYVVDLNRSEEDIDADVVEQARPGPRSRLNHGLIWRTTSDGERALGRPLSRFELEERLEFIYRPYHRAVRRALEAKRQRFGFAVLLAAHSMPSVGRTTAGAPGAIRADVVPGTRGRTSAAPCFIDAVDAHARSGAWTVRHDEPYAGGFSTQTYGRPVEQLHAVQVELARRLYMDEATLRTNPSAFNEVRAWCRALVERLGHVRPRGERPESGESGELANAFRL